MAGTLDRESRTPAAPEGERRGEAPLVGLPAEPSAQAKIVSAAVRLFCEKGYEATAVREIVEAAGVTKPVLYYYFANKEALFHHVVTSFLDQFRQDLRTVCQGDAGDLRQQLRSIVDAYTSVARREPAQVRFLHSIAYSGVYDSVIDFVDYATENYRLVEAFLERAQQRGLARTDIPSMTLTRSFMGLAEVLMRAIAYCPELVDDPDAADNTVRVFLEGAEPRVGLEEGGPAR